MSARIGSIAGAYFVCACSCGTSTPATAGHDSTRVTVADSAGITIVEHGSLEGAPRITLGAPLLRLGGLSANENDEFDPRNPFLSPVQLSSGVIVVNDYERLKWFSPEGKYVTTSGRGGGGPGEFSQVREVCRLRGDTVLSIDYSSGRHILWDANGRHVATHNRPGFVPFGACDEDGSLVVQGARTNVDPDSAAALYSIQTIEGRVLYDLGELPAPVYVQPFLLEPTFLVRHGVLYVAPASTYTVERRRLNGTLFGILRVHIPLQSITEEDLRKAFAYAFPPGLGMDGAKHTERLMKLKRPSTYPAYGRVLVDDSARIWINDYLDRRHWTVFSSSGHLVGKLVIEGAQSELATIENGRVVLRHRDPDGALWLTFHKLITSPN